MARSRNIKPGLYKNEDLAECSIWSRYLFPALWMLADREGRLEDRPKRIKGDVFPFDSIEVGPLLDELAEFGMIKRYQCDGFKVIKIVTFSQHQSPHGKEADSIFPDENGVYTVHERKKDGYVTGKITLVRKEIQDQPDTSPRQVRDKSETSTGQAAPDCGFLNPDMLNPDIGGDLAPEPPAPTPESTIPESLPAALPEEPKRKNGTRLPEDWTPTDEQITWARQEKPHWTPQHMQTVADTFRDYWCAKTGKGATKLDWDATWRNWVRNQYYKPRMVAGSDIPRRVPATEDFSNIDYGVGGRL